MSHAATNCAFQQRGLKPATKIVLWFLCDRHNPDFGCFPTQARLAEDAEMSISALNEHLATLEDLRLIHRIRAQDPHSHRRLPTRYILGFEQGFPQKPTPESGDGFVEITEENDTPSPETADGAISGFQAVPSPDFAQSHLRNPEYNLVREPLTKPVKEEEDAQAREIEFDLFFAELLNALGLDPDGILPAWWQGWPAKAHVRRWRDDLGRSEDRIIETATETRRDHPAPPDGPQALDRAMERAAKRDAQTAAAKTNSQTAKRQPKPNEGTRPSDDELAAFYADMVNSDRYLPANTISNTLRDAMLARGLVTPERLRARGVR
ncbi:MAG: helix-turn-helix domain-containing protein [Pseudorhodobacter sp.]|nr:helix-turn-helix domain-containing protein [Pseudorhodobacter sp.]